VLALAKQHSAVLAETDATTAAESDELDDNQERRRAGWRFGHMDPEEPVRASRCPRALTPDLLLCSGVYLSAVGDAPRSARTSSL
jgi:hypothetical protein